MLYGNDAVEYSNFIFKLGPIVQNENILIDNIFISNNDNVYVIGIFSFLFEMINSMTKYSNLSKNSLEYDTMN